MERYSKEKFTSFLVPILIMAAFQAVFLKQPDFGAAMSLGLLTISMLFLSGIKLRYIFSMGILVLPVVIKLISEPYRWKRVAAFLDPWKDPQGSGFQLVQSFIALGSGGLTGVGLGEGKQKLFFLPEVHTDFIFSMIGEELGFIGAALVAFLFFIFFLKGISIARKTSDPFHYYLAYGLSIMIAIQAIFNFAVVTGMLPTKGLPLPFISYGGSSLITNMMAVGLLLNVSRNHRQGTEAECDKLSAICRPLSADTGTGPSRSRGGTAGPPLPQSGRLQWQRGYWHSRENRRISGTRRLTGLRGGPRQ